MLVRDAARSNAVEVFMLRRTLAAAFAGGMYVFPGGRVDPGDGTPDVEAMTIGRSDAQASEVLGVGGGGLAYWVAAIRECFEEAGVLLARDQQGEVVRFEAPDVVDRFGGYRHAVHDGALPLVDLCRREELALMGGDIHYVSHWITPVGERRRFDTRFFVARAPEGQVPLHDDTETIDSTWVRPDEALDRCLAGDLGLLPPTIANLRFLAEHSTTESVMAASAGIGRPPAILPKIAFDENGRFVDIVMPGDPGYDELD
jgi:8-oxo-dGTP pyrophosphatase MutT (NUDIX family)